MSVSDMLVLIIGVGASLWILPWEGYWVWPLLPPGIPLWLSLAGLVEAGITRTSLALIPLVLWRRARLGGVCRPAELPLAVCAAPAIVARFDMWLFDDAELNLSNGYGFSFWLSRGTAWSLCLVVLFGLGLPRRWLADPARSLLLMLAVAPAFAWLPEPWIFNTLPVHYSQAGHGEELVCVLSGLLTYFIPAVIGAAAIRDLARERSRAGVLEWLGLALAACVLAAVVPEGLWGAFGPAGIGRPGPPLGDLHLHVIYFGGPVLAGALGAWFVQVTEWRRTAAAGA
jgi:hypothetical protein